MLTGRLSDTKRWNTKRQGRYKLICRYGSKPIEVVNKIVTSGIDKWKVEKSAASKPATVETLVKAFIKDGTSGFRIKGKTKIKYKNLQSKIIRLSWVCMYFCEHKTEANINAY